MSAKKSYGLRLTVGGAPEGPSNVAGVPGVFRPGRPTPVGGDTDLITYEQAKAYDRDKTVPLELVELKASEEDAIRLSAEADHDAARHGTSVPQLSKRKIKAAEEVVVEHTPDPDKPVSGEEA